MNFAEIKELITMIDKSSLKEFSLKMDNANIAMSKNNGMTPNVNQGSNTSESYRETLEHAVLPSAIQAPITIIPQEEKPVNKGGNIVAAPIVGMFYGRPAPNKPNFKSVGDRVEVGDVLCIIEAMKVMNEVTSKFSGVIEEIMVDNEAEVEFNQPLFRIV
ncbi:MAG: acetyl-CoA carboxylase biotin carboxyl carrier protein [Defluviitaleaceae bacterium]|nr:acetyl-CoA carboxylase biotin carboxyl carrier protein [Defluviitaleaceae bacterium]